MSRLAAFVLAILVSIAAMSPAIAVRPDEVLADPELEKRARDISAGLRCMVCQNQSIDDSDAELARDLRVLVRERISAGDSDEEVVGYVVSRYGEFVLLKPVFNWRNALLWSTPAILLAFGAVFLVSNARRRARPAIDMLDAGEEEELHRILKEREDEA